MPSRLLIAGIMEEVLAYFMISCGTTITITSLITMVFFSHEHLKKNFTNYFIRYSGVAFLYNLLMFIEFSKSIIENDEFITNFLLLQNVLLSAGLSYGIYYIKPM